MMTWLDKTNSLLEKKFLNFVSCRRPTITFYLFTFFGILTSSGLKNVELEIPSYLRQGEDVIFRCHYDLGSDFLYTVKFYRNGEEFYRYVPKEVPPQQVFRLSQGILDVDMKFSNDHDVLLRNLSLNQSGDFKCVVSAEATFQTVQTTKTVTIVGIGYESPRLFLDHVTYSPGKWVQANCTLEKTFPTPNVTWFINGREIGLLGLKSGLDLIPDQFQYPLATIVATLNFTLAESFLPTSITCRMILFDIYDESITKLIQPIPPFKNGRKFYLKTTSMTILDNTLSSDGNVKSTKNFAEHMENPTICFILMGLSLQLVLIIIFRNYQEM